MREDMIKKQTNKLRNLEDLFQEFQCYFTEKQNKLKNQIIINDRSQKRAIDEFGEYISLAEECVKDPRKINESTIDALKTHLKGANKTQMLKLEIDKSIFLEKLDNLLNETVRVLPHG